MRKISQVKVDEIAFHILDHHSNRGLVLSQALVSTAQNIPVADYICQHITNSLGDEAAKAAKFFPSSTQKSIVNLAQDLFVNSTKLLNISQQIAEILYEIIKDDMRISSGVLAVCSFEDMADRNQPYLAILKLDRGSSFREKVTTDATGKTIIDFETISNTVPSANERLQKCAFIRQSDPENNYDLLVLDRQARRVEGVSEFFAKKFLNLKFAFDSKTSTEGLYKGLAIAANRLRPRLTKEEQSNLRQATSYIVTTEFVDVNDFISSL